MASEQNQDGWDDATNTFPSKDYSMKTWGDEINPDHHEQQTEEESKSLEQLAQEYLAQIERKQGAEDPFDYTPWIAALPMPLVKEIEQGLRVNGLKLRALGFEESVLGTESDFGLVPVIFARFVFR
jgi:hypothetical protein